MAVLLEVEPPQGVTDIVLPYQGNFAILEKNRKKRVNSNHHERGKPRGAPGPCP
jgi:hypothetical protein